MHLRQLHRVENGRERLIRRGSLIPRLFVRSRDNVRGGVDHGGRYERFGGGKRHRGGQLLGLRECLVYRRVDRVGIRVGIRGVWVVTPLGSPPLGGRVDVEHTADGVGVDPGGGGGVALHQVERVLAVVDVVVRFVDSEVWVENFLGEDVFQRGENAGERRIRGCRIDRVVPRAALHRGIAPELLAPAFALLAYRLLALELVEFIAKGRQFELQRRSLRALVLGLVVGRFRL